MMNLGRISWLCLGAVQAALSAVIRVPADQPTIQAGIDAAGEGDTVLVAPRTYTGVGNRALDFGGIDRVLLSEEGPDATVVDSGDSGRGLSFHSGETAFAVVKGLSFRRGSAAGGGIHCSASSPTLKNCTISNNRGSGTHCTDASSPAIEHCMISGNRGRVGAGVMCEESSSPALTNCAIVDNSARSGGGLCCDSGAVPRLRDCTIAGNTAVSGGGAGCYRSSPTFVRCTVVGNAITTTGYPFDGRGGGLNFRDSSPTIEDCTISGNTATGWDCNGGGLYVYDSSPTLTNCAVTGNTVDWGQTRGGGGGIAFDGSTPKMKNCTISDNTVYGGGGGRDLLLNQPCTPGCLYDFRQHSNVG